MSEKIYKSYRQQINILRSRGMIIGKGSQGSRVMRILERENYYNVVNGYKDLFLASRATATSDEVYKIGTTFDEVYALYNFDRELRNIYLKYLLKLENTFKTVIAHEFSEKYGHDNYLKIENFDTSNERSISTAIKLIGDIQQEIARQMSKHHQVVTHYMTEHGYIPLWVLVNVLTFGKYKNSLILFPLLISCLLWDIKQIGQIFLCCNDNRPLYSDPYSHMFYLSPIITFFFTFYITSIWHIR